MVRPALRGFVGLAMARIRDKELFREEYDSFEAYCLQKWEHKRSYVSRIISAAQVFRYLLTNSQQRQPECETLENWRTCTARSRRSLRGRRPRRGKKSRPRMDAN